MPTGLLALPRNSSGLAQPFGWVPLSPFTRFTPKLLSATIGKGICWLLGILFCTPSGTAKSEFLIAALSTNFRLSVRALTAFGRSVGNSIFNSDVKAVIVCTSVRASVEDVFAFCKSMLTFSWSLIIKSYWLTPLQALQSVFHFLFISLALLQFLDLNLLAKLLPFPFSPLLLTLLDVGRFVQ